jgi:hypothetical protein
LLVDTRPPVSNDALCRSAVDFLKDVDGPGGALAGR